MISDYFMCCCLPRPGPSSGQSGVWCKRIDVSHLVVKHHSLYRCRLVLLTPYACRPAIDDSVLTVVVREYIVVFS